MTETAECQTRRRKRGTLGVLFVSVAGLSIDCDTPQRGKKKELMLQFRMKVLSGLDFWKVEAHGADAGPSIQGAQWMERRRRSVSVHRRQKNVTGDLTTVPFPPPPTLVA